MAKYILLDTIAEERYALWALHSGLPDYQVAFFLNKYCQTHFRRNPKPILWGTNEIPFEHFSWKVPAKGIHFELIANRSQQKEKKQPAALSLFDLPQTKEVYLASQFKNVDFFIVQYNLNSLSNFSERLELTTAFEMIYQIEPSLQPNELNLIRD